MAIPKIKQLQSASPKTKKGLLAVLITALVLLLASFGLELTNNDWDIEKLLSGESWSDSRVRRDKDGNIVESGGKYTDEYNCDDFETQDAAQRFFEKAGGVSEDTNRLDGDKDSDACESLPKEDNN